MSSIKLFSVFALAVGLVSALSVPATATEIVAGSTFLPGQAIQDITLLPNTPFNPTNAPILLDDLFGIGGITLNRDTQVGSTINISTASGLYYGSHPLLGDYVFGSIAPLTSNDYSGSITNVVQNPADPGFATGQASSFASGNLVFGGASFGFEFLSGPATGIKLFTDPSVPFSFSAVLDGLPPSAGTTLFNSGPAVLEITFQGRVVATSSDRRIVGLAAVPEPSGILLVTIAGAVTGAFAARRRVKA